MDSKKKLIIKIVSVVCVVAVVIGVWGFHVRKTNFDEVAVTTPDGEYVTDESGEIVTIPREELEQNSKNGNKDDEEDLEAYSLPSGLTMPDNFFFAGNNGNNSQNGTTSAGGNQQSPNGGNQGGNGGNSGSATEAPTVIWRPEDEVTTGKNTETIPELNTPAKIVAYFNNSANNVKKNRPALSYNRSTTMSMSIPGLPGGNLPTRTDSDSGSYKKGTNLNNVFPVNGQTWSSQLPASGVKSAVCVRDGDKYKIQINLKDEKNPTAKNSAIGKCIGILDPDEINDAMDGTDGSYRDMNISYSNCKISAVIDARTGNMLSVKYYMRIDMTAKVSGEGITLPMKMGVDDVQDYKMTW